MMNTLLAISPLDGRYHEQGNDLRLICSEYGLLYFRTKVEINWFIALSDEKAIAECPALSEATRAYLKNIINEFSVGDANAIKTIEKTTNHDVKAVEYFLKEKFQQIPELKSASEFLHFACTSEDINNLAYGLMLKNIREKILTPSIQNVLTQMQTAIAATQTMAMMSRTHGQPASPTTMAKEIANSYARLQKQLQQLLDVKILGKCNGAVGNFNAHDVAYPEVDWLTLSKNFVENLGLNWNPFTTQIEPHDFIAELSHNLCRLNTILIDFCQDVWHYISLGYFVQKIAENEVGSSTMPHKVNPIDFENAEGNLGIANALLNHFATKLPISRWQRDLSDSTVLRNLGVAMGHCHLAYVSLQKGLKKLAPNPKLAQEELDNHYELLTEAVQTVMRRYGIANPYETLKAFSRGKQLDKTTLHQFIDSLTLPANIQQQLKALTPSTFLGKSDVLTRMAIGK